MLKKADKLKLKALGFDVDKLEAAIKAEDEQDFEVPAINNITEEQLTERDTNTITAAKDAIFKQGKEAGIEIVGKAIVKKYNLTEVDAKDVNKLTTALDTHVAKGDDGLKEQIRLLQADKSKLETDIESERGNSELAKFDSELLGYFPAARNTDLTDSDRLLLIKSRLKFDKDDAGNRFASKDNQPIREKNTQAYTPIKNVVESMFTESKWIGGNGGGRGGDDNPGGDGKAVKYSQVLSQYKAANPNGNELSPAFSSMVSEAAKDNANFDWGN